MKWISKIRTFAGELKKLRNRKVRLANVYVDCGERGVSVFRIVLSSSDKGNPVITVRTKKVHTGQLKHAQIMSTPDPAIKMPEETSKK